MIPDFGQNFQILNREAACELRPLPRAREKTAGRQESGMLLRIDSP